MGAAGALVVAGLTGCSRSQDTERSTRPPATVELGGHLIDDEGRVIVLHGTNVDLSAKLDPISFGDISDRELDLMAYRFGFDHVRLLVFWSAIEPTPGAFDDDYLDALGRELDRYRRRGMQVLIDLHQDCPPSRAWAPDDQATEFNGAPRWAIEAAGIVPEPAPADDHIAACLSDPVQQYLRAFFLPDAGHPELLDHYADALAELVRRFARHPAVVGFDLMNEPQLDLQTLLALQTSTAPQVKVNEPLTAVTQRLIDVARREDSDTYLFVEPSAPVVSLGYQSDLGPLRDPRNGSPRIVLAPHLYEPAESDERPAYERYVNTWFDNRASDRAAQGDPPVYLGEFGNWRSGHIDALMEAADRAQMSWANWSWSGHWALVDPNGAISTVDDRTGAPTALPLALTRVYPQAVAGVPTSWTFDPVSDTFRMSLDPKPDAAGPTVVFVPARDRYPTGWALVVDGRSTTPGDDFDPETQRLALHLDPAQPHTVCIARERRDCR